MGRRLAALALVLAGLVGAAWLWLQPSEPEPVEDVTVRAGAFPRPSAADDERAVARAWEQASELTAEERELIDGLMGGKEHRFWHAGVRMGVIHELVRYLQERYPDTWREELERILRAAFPRDADALLALWEGHESFAEWMREHRAELARLSPEERRAHLWEARREHFGDAADQLFEGIARNEAIRDALDRIDALPEADVETRFDEYVSAIGEEYGDAQGAFMERHRQEVLDRFLQLGSVQSELQELGAEARYERLHGIREASGMPADALGRWDDLDRRRDERWEAGQAYMSAREEATERLEGEVLEAELQRLREQHLGAEAATVRNEEEAGYFRFREQRTYGVN